MKRYEQGRNTMNGIDLLLIVAVILLAWVARPLDDEEDDRGF